MNRDTYVDGSVYPDRSLPAELVTDEDKADYLHRIVSAFDCGVVPDDATLNLVAQLKDIFDRFPLSASPAYHALRTFFGWNKAARPFFTDPAYLKFEQIEGRNDGFEDSV